MLGEDVRQHRRAIRLVYVAGIIVIVLAVVASIAAVVARQQRETAQRQLRIATSRFLASEARMRSPAQHSQSLLLSLEALDVSDTPEARSSLYETLAQSPQVVRYLQPQTGLLGRIDFSPDGRTLAISDGRAVELWSVHDGRRARRIDVGGHLDVKYLNARTLAVIDDEFRGVRLLDLNSGGELGRLDPPVGSEQIRSLVAGGGMFATGDDRGQVMLWDSRARRPLGPRLRGHFSRIDYLALALASADRLLAAADTDGDISVWRLDGPPRLVKQLFLDSTQHGNLNALALSRDGKHLAVIMQDGSLFTWNVADWSRRSVNTGSGSETSSVAFSSDGKLLASSEWRGPMRLWDARSGKPVGTPLRGHIAAVHAMTFASTGQTLASASNDGNVILWEPLREDRLARVFPEAGSRKVSTLASATTVIAWVEDGHLVLSGPGGTHEVLAAKSGQELGSIALDPNGRTLAATVSTGSYSRKATAVYLWRLSDRRVIHKLDLPGFGGGLSFSSDGHTLATGHTLVNGGGHNVVLWDTASGGRIGRPVPGLEFALSPTGHLLATISPECDLGRDCGAVELWDVRTRKRLARLDSVKPVEALGVNFSADGRTLGTGDIQGNLVLWDVASRRRIGEPLTGQTGGVRGPWFSPDGHLAATTEGDGSMLLWDLDVRRPLGPPLRRESPAFSPDGRALWSISPDGGIVVRPMDVASWQKLACSLANRNLSPREWEQFLADVKKYEPTCPGRDQGRPAEVSFRGD